MDRDRHVLRVQDEAAAEFSRTSVAAAAIDTPCTERLTPSRLRINRSEKGKEAMSSNRPARPIAAAPRLTTHVSIAFAGLALIAASALPSPARGGDVPTFAVDASWPKPLPNNRILGQVGGITTDAQGHIWVIHRP